MFSQFSRVSIICRFVNLLFTRFLISVGGFPVTLFDRRRCTSQIWVRENSNHWVFNSWICNTGSISRFSPLEHRMLDVLHKLLHVQLRRNPNLKLFRRRRTGNSFVKLNCNWQKLVKFSFLTLKNPSGLPKLSYYHWTRALCIIYLCTPFVLKILTFFLQHFISELQPIGQISVVEEKSRR